MTGDFGRNKLRPIIWIVAVALLAAYCANPVTPSGGPKDEIPPQYVSSIPPNYSIRFEGDRIEIEFDEFIELKDITNQVVVSPPLQEKPDYRFRGKTLIIRLNEELMPNSTYTVFFGEAIVDLTENNPLTGFEYVFSTGDYLDSLSIKGQVLDAFNHAAMENVLVALYSDNNDTIPFDSLPLLVKPRYLTKTLQDGSFELNNLANESYLIFALNDANRTFIFDQPSEQIAFLDSLITPEYYEPPFIDTLQSDSLLLDSLQLDTLTIEQSPLDFDNSQLTIDNTLDSLEAPIDTLPEVVHTFYELFMFTEIDSTQRLLEAEEAREGMLRFVFRMPPVKGRISLLEPDTLGPVEDWAIVESSRKKDTIDYYLKYSNLDTMYFEVADDTLVLDTTRIIIKQDGESRKGLFAKKDKETPSLKIGDNLRSRQLDMNRVFALRFAYPIMEYDFEPIWFVNNGDTIKPEPTFNTRLRKELLFPFPYEENTEYEVYFPDSIFYDIRGLSHDSISKSFSTYAMADYGILLLNVTPIDSIHPTIIQLTTEDGQVMKEKSISKTEKIRFDYIIPGNYVIKAIADRNANGEWDTGKYIFGIQPERVYYYPNTIEVRANWDIEERWRVGD